MASTANGNRSRNSVKIVPHELQREFGRELRGEPIHWDKKMSNNCAFALLVYTLLQIFVVVGGMETSGISIAPYFGLVLLVGIIIPFCRHFERRWEYLQNANLPPSGIAFRFRRDQIVLWALALGLPGLFLVVFRALGMGD